jgi:hypothetical protein
MTTRRLAPLLLAALAPLAACGDDGDPASSGGQGTVRFTTWGEEYIEQEIPAGDGETGFLDGWAVQYDKFLVSYHNITVADDAGAVGYQLAKPVFVDNAKPGKKELMPAFALAAKAWTKVSYDITTASADATVVGGADPADLAMMVQNGYSLYVEGKATKGAVTKTFHWGFKTQTHYQECQQATDGQNLFGIVVTNGGVDTSELTTHGDHLFYNRLQSSPDPAQRTVLLFDEQAAADDAPNGDGDGEVSLPELCQKQFDPGTYDPSGFNVASIGDFVINLSRTVGHFRGEGECEVAPLEARRPAFPCDDYR